MEELVTIEEDVVTEPAASGGQDSRPEVVEGEAEGLHIVAGDVGLLLGRV